MNKKFLLPSCPPSSDLSDQPLFSNEQACLLEKTFKMLANATRLRLLHALALEQEVCVSDLAKILDMNTTAVSNQLQRLSDRGIVAARKQGLKVFYRILDPCAVSVVNHAWCLAQCAGSRQGREDQST